MTTITDKMFYLLQETWRSYPDPYLRSALFFYLSSCSDKGLPSSGEFSKLELDPFTLHRLKTFEVSNFHIAQQPFEYNQLTASIIADDKFNYHIFPVGKFAFNFFNDQTEGPELTNVNHELLKSSIDQIKNKNLIVIYKFHKYVLEMYQKYNIMMVDKYGNITNSNSSCEEIIVTNF